MARLVAHHRPPHRARTDVSTEIDRDARLLEVIEVLTQRAPRLPRVRLLAEREVWPRRADFAGYFAGDALSDLRHRVRPAKDGKLRVAEHVDEPGRYDLISRIDDATSAQSRNRGTDVSDAIPAYSDAATIPWVAGTIDDAGVGDEEIVGSWIAPRGNRCATGH
jgi:hypothetical protein